MNTSYSYQNSLSLLYDNKWSKLNLQTKVAVMQSIENEIARRENRSPCNVSLFSEPPQQTGIIAQGQYNRMKDIIELNSYYLKDAGVIGCLMTILHEGRHAYQSKAVYGEIYHHNQAEVIEWRSDIAREADAENYTNMATMQIIIEQRMQNSTNN